MRRYDEYGDQIQPWDVLDEDELRDYAESQRTRRPKYNGRVREEPEE